MSQILKKFGQVVVNNIEKHPNSAQNLLKFGFTFAYSYCRLQM